MNVIFKSSPLQARLAMSASRWMRFLCFDDLASRALSEQRAADADQRRAFGDRRLEIVRHAHRQGVEHKPLACAAARISRSIRNCAR